MPECTRVYGEHHCARTRREYGPDGGNTRARPCCTKIHIHCGRQAAYKGKARPSKYICAYIFSPARERGYTIREDTRDPSNKKGIVASLEIKRTRLSNTLSSEFLFMAFQKVGQSRYHLLHRRGRGVPRKLKTPRVRSRRE